MRVVPGEGPVEIRALAAGLVNATCQVARAGRLYSLRVGSAAPGVDRDWECKVMARAAAAGLAPAVRCCEPGEGILVADWVQSRPWSAAQALEAEPIRAMAALLHRVHALAIPQPPRAMNPASWVAFYGQPERPAATAGGSSASASSAGCSTLHAAAAARLAQLALLPAAEAVLCHGDLHRLNIVGGRRLLLLDWEYAHVSEPFWDLAGWIANNDGAEGFAADLLAAYLERPADPQEAARLELLVWLYDYVCLLWSARHSSRGSDGAAAVAARAEVLAARLAASRV